MLIDFSKFFNNDKYTYLIYDKSQNEILNVNGVLNLTKDIIDFVNENSKNINKKICNILIQYDEPILKLINLYKHDKLKYYLKLFDNEMYSKKYDIIKTLYHLFKFALKFVFFYMAENYNDLCHTNKIKNEIISHHIGEWISKSKILYYLRYETWSDSIYELLNEICDKNKIEIYKNLFCYDDYIKYINIFYKMH